MIMRKYFRDRIGICRYMPLSEFRRIDKNASDITDELVDELEDKLLDFAYDIPREFVEAYVKNYLETLFSTDRKGVYFVISIEPGRPLSYIGSDDYYG